MSKDTPSENIQYQQKDTLSGYTLWLLLVDRDEPYIIVSYPNEPVEIPLDRNQRPVKRSHMHYGQFLVFGFSDNYDSQHVYGNGIYFRIVSSEEEAEKISDEEGLFALEDVFSFERVALARKHEMALICY